MSTPFPPNTPSSLESLRLEARALIGAARSANTLRAYRADWKDFESWCEQHSLPVCPATPHTVILYLTDLARSKKPTTLSRRLAAISQVHQGAGFPSPTSSAEIRALLSGIRRTKGVFRTRKRPLLAVQLVQSVNCLPETLLGIRNRAMLLTGFAGALRRGELASLCWEQVEKAGWEILPEAETPRNAGLKITILRSKTDPHGEGRSIGIPFGETQETCPVRALWRWREVAGINTGPVFRVLGRAERVMPDGLSGKAVSRLVKQAVRAVGLDPLEYSGHSLRAGLATSAAAAGASERSIMAQTGHRDLKTARSYIRDGSLFLDNAAAKIAI